MVPNYVVFKIDINSTRLYPIENLYVNIINSNSIKKINTNCIQLLLFNISNLKKLGL